MITPMITLQQTFDVALDMVMNRERWSCFNAYGIGCFLSPDHSYGCYLGQTILDYGILRNAGHGIHHDEEYGITYDELLAHPLGRFFENMDSIAYNQLVNIHDKSKSREEAYTELLHFAEIWGLGINIEVGAFIGYTSREPAIQLEVPA